MLSQLGREYMVIGLMLIGLVAFIVFLIINYKDPSEENAKEKKNG